MSNRTPQSPRSRIIQRLWKPAAVIGAGGTAVAVWFDELLIYGDKILALIFMVIVGGIMYLFNILLFKSQMPRPEDIKNFNDKGVKK